MSNYITGKRVEVPLFEPASKPTINITDLTKRRFSLIDRIRPKRKYIICG
jgi:hypothetical protein